MNTRTSHRTLEHLGIFDSICQLRITGSLSLLKFAHGLDGVGKVHLRCLAINLRQTIRNGLTQGIRFSQRQLLDTGHILDRVLCGHRGIGNDMGTVLVTVLIFHPFQHLAAPVVVEVGIDIRERDTVGVEETLKQQVVLQRVDLRDT